MFRNTNQADWQEFLASLKQQAQPWLPLVERPCPQLVSQLPEPAPGQQVCKFRHRGRHAASYFVPTDTGEDYTMAF